MGIEEAGKDGPAGQIDALGGRPLVPLDLGGRAHRDDSPVPKRQSFGDMRALVERDDTATMEYEIVRGHEIV